MFTTVKVTQHPDDVDHFLFNVLYKSAVLVCIFFKLSIKADMKLLYLWNMYHEASAEILQNVLCPFLYERW